MFMLYFSSISLNIKQQKKKKKKKKNIKQVYNKNAIVYKYLNHSYMFSVSLVTTSIH